MRDDVKTPDVFIYRDIEWDKLPQVKAKNIKKMFQDAETGGLRRKKVVRGEGGFFMNRSQMPPGFKVPEHSHSHDEYIMVLKGGCTFDDGTVLEADDSIVIHANYRYGFTIGPNGMDFITMRAAEASVTIDQKTFTT